MTWPNDEHHCEPASRGWTAPADPPRQGESMQVPDATDPMPPPPPTPAGAQAPQAPPGPQPIPPDPGQVPRYGQYAPTPPPGQAPPPQTWGQPANPWGSAPGWQQPAGQGDPGYPAPGYGPPSYPGAPGMAYQPPAAQPGIIPLRPLSMWEIFDGAFRAVRHNPKAMFGVSAVVVAVTVGLSSLISWYATRMLTGGTRSFFGMGLTPAEAEQLSGIFASVYASLFSLPFSTIATAILVGLLIPSVSRSVLGKVTPVSDLVRGSGKHLGQLLLFTLGAMVVRLVPVAAIVGLGFALASAPMWAPAVVVGLVGLALYVVAAFWFEIRVLLVPAGLMLERGSFWPTIARGWRLTRGRFWRLLGLYLLMTIIIIVVSQIVVMPASLIAQLVASNLTLASSSSLLIVGVATVITSTVTTAFSAGVIALAYIDARIRTEGLDIELARAAGNADTVA